MREKEREREKREKEMAFALVNNHALTCPSQSSGLEPMHPATRTSMFPLKKNYIHRLKTQTQTEK